MKMLNKDLTLVSCYVDPDLDGYAGVFAYTEFLKHQASSVEAGIIGMPHVEVEYVVKRFKIESLKSIANDKKFERVILVDASDIKGLEGKVTPEKVIEIIDHRKVNDAALFKQAKVQIELVGAAATLIAEKFQQAGLAPSQQSAILLYSAIISNTLNFKAKVTTDRDKGMATWLKQFVVVVDDYPKDLFLAKSDLSGEKLALRIAGDLACFEFGHKKIGIAQLEIVGARTLIDNRGQEIISALNKIKSDLCLDIIFQNTIDLDAGNSYIIADEKQTQAILAKSLGVEFEGIAAVAKELIMRKQIVPLIKEELER